MGPSISFTLVYVLVLLVKVKFVYLIIKVSPRITTVDRMVR